MRHIPTQLMPRTPLASLISYTLLSHHTLPQIMYVALDNSNLSIEKLTCT